MTASSRPQRSWFHLLWLLLLVACLSGAAGAAEYYVNDASTAGDVYCSAAGAVGNTGTSSASPTLTVQAVIDNYVLAPGDIVYVDSGTYTLTGAISITAADSGATFQGAGAGVTVIDGGGSQCFDLNAFQGTIEGFTVQNGADAALGGGLECTAGTALTLTNCVVCNNLSGGNGGGLNVDASTLTMSGCTLTDNQAPLGGGGAVSAYNGSVVTITGNTICGNTAGTGAISLNNASGAITGNLIVGNSAGNSAGGVLVMAGGTVAVNGNTIAHNEAGGSGGGVYIDATSPTLSNNILWGNIAGSTGPQLGINGAATPTVSYCDVAGGLSAVTLTGGATVTWAAGNIDADPLFAVTTTGAWSPAVTATYNASTAQSVITDTAAAFAPGAYAGILLNPDTSQSLQFVVVTNTATTMVVWGDASTLPQSGDGYRIWDYHPQSQSGHYAASGWAQDPATSPCIDAGDTAATYTAEPAPNGGRVNMGRYGDTAQASLAYTTYALTVQSSPEPGASITGSHPGTTDYTSPAVVHNTPVTLTAPSTLSWGAADYDFYGWQLNGSPQTNGQTTLAFNIAQTSTAVAVYASQTRMLAVQSTPITGVAISGSTPGTTNYTEFVDDNSAVSLTAPAQVTSGGTTYDFVEWQLGGASQGSTLTLSFTIQSATSAVAVYEEQTLPAAAPTGLVASDGAYADKVALTWNAVANATGYKVYRSETNDSTTATLTGSPASAAYDDTTAVQDTIYYYWVKASNAAGDSGFSTGDSGYATAPGPTQPTTDATELVNGAAVTVPAAAVDLTEFHYRIPVPAGATQLTVALQAGVGNPRLYVKYGEKASATNYDYGWTWSVGSESKTFNISNPDGGDWFIMVVANPTIQDYTLTATHNSPITTAPPTDLTATDGYYADKVRVMWLGNSTAQSYEVWRNTTPDSSAATKIATTADSHYDDANVTASTVYFYWVQGVSGTQVSGSLGYDTGFAGSAPATLDISGLSGVQGSMVRFTMSVGADGSGTGSLNVTLSGGSGDCDLYVKFGSQPTLSDWDYKSATAGTSEHVSVSDAQAGNWCIMLYGSQTYSGVNLSGQASGSSSSASELSNGVPVTDLNAERYSDTHYFIDVPEGASDLVIATSGGTGDCDLYVKFGEQAATDNWDYRPYKSGNNESVTVASPSAGTWHVMLHAYRDYAGMSLVGSYSGGGSAPSDVTVLSNGVPVADCAGAKASETHYKIATPEGATSLVIQIDGGTGDCDLYVRYGEQCTTSNWDYRPYKGGNNETVTVANPTAGDWYVMLRGYRAYSGVSLQATYAEGGGGGGGGSTPGLHALDNGVPVGGLAGDMGSELHYTVCVSGTATSLVIQTEGGTGDCDLYVRYGEQCTTSNWDYRPYKGGNNETVTVADPTAGDWYVMLRGYRTFDGVTLTATHDGDGGGGGGTTTTSVPELDNGTPVTDLSGTQASQTYYKMTMAEGVASLEIEISGGTGDCDLYVRFDQKPTSTQWDYRPYRPGNSEKVTVSNPAAGDWYIMLRGYRTYAGVTLQGSY